MPPDSSTKPARSKLALAWRAAGGQPATGRSFLVVIIVAAVLSIGVTIWRLSSLGSTGRARGAPADFRM
ncbi:MAG TPA: hypothetical protein VHO67_22375 [Polyangia bacterium]|nr:hypothetical protein [Polyangia bacterium]